MGVFVRGLKRGEIWGPGFKAKTKGRWPPGRVRSNRPLGPEQLGSSAPTRFQALSSKPPEQG